MKASRVLCSALAVAAATLLVGCATTPPQSTSRHEVNGNYVQAVENIARSRGVSVHWINPPERRVAAAVAQVDD